MKRQLQFVAIANSWPVGSIHSLWQISTAFHSLLSSPDGRYFCSIEHKSNQKCPLLLRSERTKNHRQVVIYPKVGDKREMTSLFSVTPIGDFFISAFCFSGALSRTSLFKTALYQLTATLLLSHSLFSSSSLRVLYSLPPFIPTVDSRWSEWFG